MASNSTKNYGLCQWVRTDKVLMADFNADNAKIDAALAEKASAAVVSGLQSAVSGKADQSALDTLSQTVAEHSASLLGKGNCQIYTTSYTGTGLCGMDHPNSISFPKQPMFVLVFRGNAQLFLPFGLGATAALTTNGQYFGVSATWSEKQVQWFSTDAVSQMNSASVAYQVLAFLAA